MLVGIFKKSFLVLFLLVTLPVVLHAQVLININTAGSVELETLNGIGPSKAQAIIDYRTQNGLFGNIEDIKNVSGIGDVTFSNIKDFITVGETGPATIATTTEEITTTSTTASNQESSSSGSSSSHYSAASISSLKISPGFEVSAGRDRLGTAGSPLEFKVETNIDYTNNSIFVWNFGDGTEGVGEVVTHTYMYPGEYVLMLNVSGPRGKAVSRANVKVVSPELVITHASRERVEITNNSKGEISLFGRALVTRDKIFAFPRDTIIKTGQKISFGANVTGLDISEPSEVSLMVVGTEIKPQEIMAKIEEQRLEKIAQVNNQLSTLRQQLADVSSQKNFAKSTWTTKNPIIEEPIAEGLVKIESNASQTASVINAVTPEESPGIIKNLLQTLKRFFFRTEQ